MKFGYWPMASIGTRERRTEKQGFIIVARVHIKTLGREGLYETSATDYHPQHVTFRGR